MADAFLKRAQLRRQRVLDRHASPFDSQETLVFGEVPESRTIIEYVFLWSDVYTYAVKQH